MADTPARLVRFIRPEKFEELTGITAKAVERKAQSGAWLHGHEYVRAPDGRILVDLEGYERWAVGQRRAG